MGKYKEGRIIFIQPLDPYRHDIIVAAGATKEDILRFCKKEKVIREFTDIIREEVDAFPIAINKLGLFFWRKKGERLLFLLLLRPFQDKWEYWECLIHELAHVVQRLAVDKMMESEDEARAYLQEFLFRSIRRKLQGVE